MRSQREHVGVAEPADHDAHLGERTRGLLLDDGERVHGGLGMRDRDDPARLGPDGDGRDVMGNRVMQLPGQLLTLPEPDLVQLAGPGGGPVPDRGTECCREQQNHAAEDGFDHAV